MRELLPEGSGILDQITKIDMECVETCNPAVFLKAKGQASCDLVNLETGSARLLSVMFI